MLELVDDPGGDGVAVEAEVVAVGLREPLDHVQDRQPEAAQRAYHREYDEWLLDPRGGLVHVVHHLVLRLPGERHEPHPGHVESRHACGQQDQYGRSEHQWLVVQGCLPRLGDDGLLRPEPPYQGYPDYRHGADHHGCRRHGQLGCQAAHVPHVLRVEVVVVVVPVALVEVVVGVVHLVYHRAARHEEHPLGHGVVEQVEHGSPEDQGRRVGLAVVVEPERDPESREYVCQLAHRRVGQHLLDVVLHERYGGCHERRYPAYVGDNQAELAEPFHPVGAHIDERYHARDQVQAGVDHRRCVYQGRDGGRALHCVWQPDVKRELRRLAHRPDEEHQEGPEQLVGVDSPVEGGVLEYHRELERPVDVVEDQESHHQEDVAHAGGQEGLLGCVRCALLPEVEAYEEVGAEAHNLPEYEEPQEVVSEDHAEHPHGEEDELGVEAVVPVLVYRVRVHVAHAEPADQEAQEGGDEQQHQGDRVHPDPNSDHPARAHRVVREQDVEGYPVPP